MRSTPFARAVLILSVAACTAGPGPARAGGLSNSFVLRPWYPSGAGTTDYLGFIAAPAGDVNGDGYGDVLVSLGSEDVVPDGAQLFLGSATGPDAVADWTYGVNQSVIYVVAPAGDVNADGYADVVVGIPYWNTMAHANEGRVVVFHGGPSGLPAVPSYELLPPTPADNLDFGISVVTAGDVNGDGYADVIVGAHGYTDGTNPQRGAAYVYHGGPAGLAAAPARTLIGAPESGNFGYQVSSAGDVDGDGFGDVLVGAYTSSQTFAYAGAASLFLGSASGVAAVADTVIRGTAVEAYCGQSVANAGDVNGDGYADILIGSPGLNGFAGEVQLLFGGPQGVASGVTVNNAQPLPLERFGLVVATLGDLDGDGYADFGIHALNQPGGHGRIAVYRGRPTGPLYLGEVLPIVEDGIIGQSFAASGDTDGDGRSEILVGDPFRGAAPGEHQGYAFLFGMPRSTPQSAAGWPLTGPQPGTHYGQALAIVPPPLDGTTVRLLIGDPGYDGVGRVSVHSGLEGGGVNTTASKSIVGTVDYQSFGARIVDAGDVDRDGFCDFLVASPTLDFGAIYQAGRVAFHSGVVSNPPLPTNFAFGEHDFDRVGSALAGRGDVNGDGYQDVLVGAWEWNSATLGDCGKVWLYLGSPTGPVASTWSAEGTAFYQGLGASVALLDFDGDGYSDIAVGSSSPPSGGPVTSPVQIYYGGPDGPASTPGTLLGPLSVSFGYCVASLGDVTGDGVADLGVGAPDESGAGAFYLYTGQRSRPPSPQPFGTMTGSQAGGRLGACFAGGGDVDGDGIGDFVVGEPGWSAGQTGEGRVHLFYGRPFYGTGLAADLTFESDVVGANLGASFATLADINQDGFADLVAGAPGAAGRVYTLLGGGDPGAVFKLHVFDLEDLMLRRRFHPGRGTDTDRFRAVMGLRSPAGRARLNYEFEVTARTETPPVTSLLRGSSYIDTGSPGSVPAILPILQPFTPGVAYGLRGRILSRSPYFPRSRWITTEGHSSGDPDLWTAGSTVNAPPAGGADPKSPRILAVVPSPAGAGLATRIQFALPRTALATIDVHDARGAQVRRLLRQVTPAGASACAWDGRDASGRIAPAGVYFVVLAAEGRLDHAKVVRLP